MKNDNSENDLDSIAKLLRVHSVFLELLLHRVARVEATTLVLAEQTLPDEGLQAVKELEDEILSKTHKRLIAEVEHDFENS